MQENASPQREGRIVSLEDYVEAYSIYKNFLAKLSEEDAKNLDNQPEVQSAREKFNQIRDVFTRENGQILNRYICGYSTSAAMICLKKNKGPFSRDTIRFFSQYELGTNPEIESLLIEIDFLAAESTRLLRGKNLNRCLGLIYKVARNTLVLLDSMGPNKSHSKLHGNAGQSAYLTQEEAPEEIAEGTVVDEKAQKEKLRATIKVVKENLAHARAYHEKAAKLTAQMDYFMGNLLGFVGIIAMLAIVAWMNDFSFSNLEKVLEEDGAVKLKVATLMYFGITAGCIGAIISVMTRISSGNLQLNHEPDSQTIRIVGLIRPFIGGVFGGLLLLLLNSGLSIFNMADENASKAIANFIVLGFIAGFFERFVPDILDQTRGKLAGGEEPAALPPETATASQATEIVAES